MSDNAPPSSKSSTEPTPLPNGRGTGRLVIISGPSGVGKNTIVRRLCHFRTFHFSVSVTTRAARPGERAGVDYHFIDRERFSDMVQEGGLIEWAEFAGNCYGTPRDQVLERLATGEDVILDIEVNGAIQVMDAFPDAVSIFVTPPSIEELEARMRGRRDMSEAEIARRLGLAPEHMEVGRRRFGCLIVNEDLDTTVAAIMDILGSTEVELSQGRSPTDQDG